MIEAKLNRKLTAKQQERAMTLLVAFQRYLKTNPDAKSHIFLYDSLQWEGDEVLSDLKDLFETVDFTVEEDDSGTLPTAVEGKGYAFTFYWRTGTRNVLYGMNPSDALNKAGYGAGAIVALDFHASGDVDTYKWNATFRQWESKDK